MMKDLNSWYSNWYSKKRKLRKNQLPHLSTVMIYSVNYQLITSTHDIVFR